jgi:Phage terminase large subunit (GpA)
MSLEIAELAEKYPALIDAFTRNFCSPPRTFPDVWASRNVKLDSDVAEFYDPQASPYFIAPLRAIFDNQLKEICIIAPPGTGKTTLIEAMVCYVAACDPGDVLIASKNDVLLSQWLDTRLNRILARCEPLADYLPRNSDRQKKLLLLRHMFVMSRAANLASFQQVSVRWAIGDECWQWDAGLIGYLRKRLHDRWNGRTVLLSQAGYAETEWEAVCREGDQFVYLWACQCGKRQPFNFGDLKWEGVPEKGGEIDWGEMRHTIRLVCPSCGQAYLDTPENRRTLSSTGDWSMVEHGENPTHQTYTIPSMANFRVSWFEIAREFLKAKRAWKLGDREPFIQWTMQRDSKFWADRMEQDAKRSLVKGDYSWKGYTAGERINNELVRIMTIDKQASDYWVVIRAWRADGTSRLLHFKHVMGGEEELRELQQNYRVQDNAVFIDSAFESTQVYTMCHKFGWWAILGTGEMSFAHPKRDLLGHVRGTEQKLFSQIKHVVIGSIRCRLLHLASERCRDIMARLRDGNSLLWEVPLDCPKLYVEQIYAELKKEYIDPKTKRSTFKWIPISKNNHAFDMESVQVAAAILFGALPLD